MKTKQRATPKAKKPDAQAQAEAPTAKNPAPETAPLADSEQVDTVQADAGAARADDSEDDVLLQDWTPLGQCLDIRIAAGHWAGHAHELLADHQVPSLAHDSGALSERAARVLFAWCQEQTSLGTLPAEIVVVEVGMGTGLHLRFLLDAFAERCRTAGTPWYDQLTVYGTDVSPATVRRALDRGLFAPHAARIRLGFMDAAQPGWFGEIDTGATVDLRGGIHVLLANYVLDLQALDVFRRTRAADGSAKWEAVLVRTWLRDVDRLHAYSDRNVAQLLELAKTADDAAVAELAAVYTLIQLEMRAWPVDLRDHPDLAELARVADAQEAALGPDHPLLAEGTVVNHSAGALRMAQKLGLALADNGYLAVRDVAFCTPEVAGVARSYQKYGPTGAAGINLVQMDGFFAAGLAPAGMRLHAPHHDGVRNQGARLLTRRPLPATVTEFEIALDGEDMARATQLADEARNTANPLAALEKFRQAVRLEPTNWHLLAEAARSALVGAKRPDIAVAIAAKALELNTEYSPELWNVYGDALYSLGDPATALYAYEQGLLVQPRNVRLRYCAASLEASRGRYAAAFRHIGEALASDPGGSWRGEVLQLLDSCLRGQTAAATAEAARLAERDQR